MKGVYATINISLQGDDMMEARLIQHRQEVKELSQQDLRRQFEQRSAFIQNKLQGKSPHDFLNKPAGEDNKIPPKRVKQVNSMDMIPKKLARDNSINMIPKKTARQDNSVDVTPRKPLKQDNNLFLQDRRNLRSPAESVLKSGVNGPRRSRKFESDIFLANQEELMEQHRQRPNMPDPRFLSNRKGAIDMQNSLGKRPKGKRQSFNNPLNQVSNEGVQSEGDRAPKRKQSRAVMMDEVDPKVVEKLKRKTNMERNVIDEEKENDIIHQRGPRRRRNRVERLGGGGALQQQLQRDGLAMLGSFDTEAYLGPQRMLKGTDGDNMKRFQFNQVASDATPPDRHLRDYRHPT